MKPLLSLEPFLSTAGDIKEDGVNAPDRPHVDRLSQCGHGNACCGYDIDALCLLKDVHCPEDLLLFRTPYNIKACCAAIVEKHGGEVPRTMKELTHLGGVGRKTANVVLGNTFGIDVGVVVDTHIARLSQRLGLTKHTDPEKIEQDLMPLVPREQWTLFSHWLIWHGRRRCDARKPDCAACVLQGLCASAGKFVD